MSEDPLWSREEPFICSCSVEYVFREDNGTQIISVFSNRDLQLQIDTLLKGGPMWQSWLPLQSSTIDSPSLLYVELGN